MGKVRRVLLEREAILAAPQEAHALVANESEGPNGQCTAALDGRAIAECVADIVASGRVVRPKRQE